jgi:hypothetical protein
MSKERNIVVRPDGQLVNVVRPRGQLAWPPRPTGQTVDDSPLESLERSS